MTVYGENTYLGHIFQDSVSQPWSWAAHFVCLPNQTHLIQLISSLEETPGPEMSVR